MQIARLARHAVATHWRTRMLFPAATLDAIERAVGRAEQTHRGEIRFAVESSLTPLRILADLAPRERALEVFAHLKVWDTERNNGVLIYVQLADRVVEIVADRGLARHVKQAEWDSVCRMMEEHFRAGRFKAGSIAGVDAIGTLLARHFPTDPPLAGVAANQLPDRPTLL
jgi:uncharacterized membrane protein